MGPLASWDHINSHILTRYCLWPCLSLYNYNAAICWCPVSPGWCTMLYISKPLEQVSTVVSQSKGVPSESVGTNGLHNGYVAEQSAATTWCYCVKEFNSGLFNIFESILQIIKAVLKLNMGLTQWFPSLILWNPFPACFRYILVASQQKRMGD